MTTSNELNDSLNARIMERAPAFKEAFGVDLPKITHPRVMDGPSTVFAKVTKDGIPMECHPTTLVLDYLDEKSSFDTFVANRGDPASRPLPVLDGPARPSLATAVRALTNIHKAWVSLIEASNPGRMGEMVGYMENGIKRLKHVVSARDEMELAEAAQRVLTRVQQETNNAISLWVTQHANIQNQLAAALKPEQRMTQTLETEIRAHIKTRQDRVSFLQNKADRETLAAVLNAPPFLSGLDEKQIAEIKESAQKRFAPHVVKALEISDNASVAIHRTLGEFERYAATKTETLKRPQVRNIYDLRNLR